MAGWAGWSTRPTLGGRAKGSSRLRLTAHFWLISPSLNFGAGTSPRIVVALCRRDRPHPRGFRAVPDGEREIAPRCGSASAAQRVAAEIHDCSALFARIAELPEDTLLEDFEAGPMTCLLVTADASNDKISTFDVEPAAAALLRKFKHPQRYADLRAELGVTVLISGGAGRTSARCVPRACWRWRHRRSARSGDIEMTTRSKDGVVLPRTGSVRSGYVTDVGYGATFTRFLAPDWLDLTALISGFAPPVRGERFTFCELACGRGLTAAILAGTHPGGEFHAVDLMPEHIAYGRRLAERAGIDNLTLHALDFARAARLELPRFKYIVAHGVYSWVDAQAREDLRRFIDRHLAPGGLVYLSYNAMPGWAVDLPFQYLVNALAQGTPGDSIAKFAAAEAALQRFAAAGTRALKASPVFIHDVRRQRRRLPASYFAHEYLAPAWQPLYVTEVRPELTSIGLRPVGSATLGHNFDVFVLQAAQRDALSEIDDDDLRELVRDCMLMTRFRRDVFGRDVAPIDEDEQRHQLLARRFALARPESAVVYSVKTEAGTLRFDNPLARRIVAGLAHGARQLRDIDGAGGDLVANALALASAGVIRPVSRRDTPVDALNRALAEVDSEAIPLPFCALPSGTALTLEPALHRYVRGRGRLPTRLRPWRDFLAAVAAGPSVDG